ncbi:pre-peptidase C-terminal domain-containing protein [Pleionea sp. CnH1-48]|uniref:pre-peptidase C-terminal domain-containing protein n=1 Tax=Pleionea sp. CnH1-48 TaxID=2954494 RepID=UPI002097CA03|nr:pre-peptidase C-terminal domain-containing protein [Pleionea sp. CnH1-48]MCO7224957.1 pre-peptidase C-terminal domain-containing protein [Pleionea sp. CnH1-48]
MKTTISLASLFATSLFFANHATAATKHYRVIWDQNPANNAVIAFSPDGSSNSPYVKFGYSTNESQWATRQVTSTEVFRSSLTSHFVRLNGLNANTPVYFRVCDSSGCGDRLWFKTAPTDNQPYVAIAGGDTRTGWTNRRQGNQLVAKVRPLFIMHGGDFTNANNASEMNQFLEDWQLTFSSDTIDGIAYKRVYPLIPTHGNHEDNNYQTLCEVFGVDYNNDGNCNPSDTYGGFNISPLLRVYTLNSQFKNSGWSSYASAMNNWLSSDLQSNGSSAKWRFAQYHKPMFPHYTGKSDNTELFNWWADDFYNRAMNLVVESDTHINKITQSIRPSGSSFTATTSGGTVYVGEGSWGAPARSANDPKSWTIDLASIQQFKVITVSNDNIEVRTAQFDSSASTLSRTQRANDPTLLPGNVNWWNANNIGEVLRLTQNADGRSVIDSGNSGGSDLELSATDDTFISKTQSSQNFNGSSEGLLADGSDSTYGEMKTLIKWDLSNVPACSTITSAKVQFNVFNQSGGAYNIYQNSNSWTESNATWNSVNGSNHGSLMASFNPSSTGLQSITLSSHGLSIVQGWLQGNNNGVMIASGGTSDGIDINSKEQGNAPKLLLNYQTDPDCGTPGETALTNGQAVTGISGSKGSEAFYYLDVPATATSLSFALNGGSGDADLYVKFGNKPSTSSYDCRPWKNGNNETCTISNIQAGRYYVMLNGYANYSGTNLTGTYSEDTNTGGSFSKSSLSGASNAWLHYTIDVPAGMSSLSVNISGGSGDADVYVRRGSQPTSSSYDCRPWKNGNNESCSFNNPAADTWHISIHGYSSFSGVALNAQWNP